MLEIEIEQRKKVEASLQEVMEKLKVGRVSSEVQIRLTHSIR